jgi:hypothetical protein
MFSSHAPALRVIAFVLLSTEAAPAKGAQADSALQTPAWTSEESAAVGLLRVDAGGFYVRGSKLAGVGTRVPYQGAGGTLRFHAVRFPTRWIGYEVKVGIGGSSTASPEVNVALEGALTVAPLRWSGDLPGALVLGVGSGTEVGDQPSVDEGIRAYPLVLSSLRLWPTRQLGLHAAWRFAPITSNAILTNFHEIEAAMSIGLLQFGARVGIEQTTGGDPERAYRAFRLGPFIGLAGY